MMRRSKLLLASAGLILASFSARAESPWYLQADAGSYLRLDGSGNITIHNAAKTLSGPAFVTNSFDPGPTVDLGLGYKVTPRIRVFGELNYAHYVVSSTSPTSTNGAFPAFTGERLSLQSRGGRDSYAWALEALYDLPLAPRLGPYMGAGITVSTTRAAGAEFAGSNGSPTFRQLDSRGTDPGVFGEVGLNLPLPRGWSLVPSYRFQHLLVASGSITENANILKLGLRHAF